MEPNASHLNDVRKEMGLPPITSSEYVPLPEQALPASRLRTYGARLAAYMSVALVPALVLFYYLLLPVGGEPMGGHLRLHPQLVFSLATLALWAVTLFPLVILGFFCRSYASKLEKVLTWVFCYTPFIGLLLLYSQLPF